MKKNSIIVLIGLFAIGAILMLNLSSDAVEDTSSIYNIGTYKVKARNLVARKEASVSSKKMAYLHKGKSVKLQK